MKIRALIASLALIAFARNASAQDPWLHIYNTNPSMFKQFDMNDVLDISFDEESGTMTVNTDADGAIPFSLNSIDRFQIGPNNCRIDIDTDLKTYDSTFGKYEGREVYEIVSKEIYLEGTLTFSGRGIYEDVVAPVKIRGRGNSTWGYPKKPYRLKFTEKQKLGPIHKAKNLVLLANYIDFSMMRNFVAFTFGKLIDMPYINRSLPVDVYLNGHYKGSYHLTEKVGINNGSVDLPKADEPNSILFELDTYESTDEDEYPFYESTFGVPVRFSDPDAPTDYNELQDWIDKWSSELEDFFSVVSTENPAKMYARCNLETLVRYIMVFDITCNQEINHPKSVYLHKTDGGLWEFGPCWDFDWAFGYSPTYSKGQVFEYYNPEKYPTYENPLIGNPDIFTNHANKGGNEFFFALCNNSVFRAKFKEVWDDFYKNKQAEFWRLFDEYAASLEPSANLQGAANSEYLKWKSSVEDLRFWLQKRFDYINSDSNYALWED